MRFTHLRFQFYYTIANFPSSHHFFASLTSDVTQRNMNRTEKKIDFAHLPNKVKSNWVASVLLLLLHVVFWMVNTRQLHFNGKLCTINQQFGYNAFATAKANNKWNFSIRWQTMSENGFGVCVHGSGIDTNEKYLWRNFVAVDFPVIYRCFTALFVVVITNATLFQWRFSCLRLQERRWWWPMNCEWENRRAVEKQLTFVQKFHFAEDWQ